ncbi:MAG: hypothetical protein F4103_06380 [Boseongicola sp. SB0673_bin_14]|nr:hypothetical protein [Boseongicola sp. SB0673_bin_14]
MGPSDISLQMVGFRVVALLLLAGLHGGLVAAAAVLLDDKGPKHDGRLTFVPTNHVDLVGAFSLILFGLGWTKQVAVDVREMRVGRIGIVIVILTGFIGLLVAAAILDALVRPALTMLPYSAGLSTAAFLHAAASLTIWFALLSLIPVPPLTGGLILDAFGIRVSRRFQWILTAALVAAVAFGVFHRHLGPTHAFLARVVVGE